MRRFFCFIYYVFAQYLPDNYLPIFGKISRKVRNIIARRFCSKISKSANIQKHVYLGSGIDISIGNNSGLGAYSKIQNTILVMKNDVMVGEYLSVLGGGHNFSKLDVPMRLQGAMAKSELIIEDDVWIGSHVIITSGCKSIGRGAIVGAGSVLTHNVGEYEVWAGNPAKLIKNRKNV